MMNKGDSLLIIGPKGNTGGINKYIEGQKKTLSNFYNISRYDITTPSRNSYLGVLWVAVFSLFKAIKYISISRPDIVHIHASHGLSFYRAAYYVVFSAYRWDTPVILHIHGSSFDEFSNSSIISQLFQKFVFSKTSGAIVLSEYWKKELDHVIKTQKFVVPNAINIEDFNLDTNDGGDSGGNVVPHIVFISNLVQRKGVKELVDSIRNIEDEYSLDYFVSIAGDGPLAWQVEQLTDDYEHVTYYGYVSDEKKRSILNSGTIYALPSHAEGLPIGILEGMAAGNAIVSTKVGSIPNLVNEENGLLVQPRDSNELSCALVELIKNIEMSKEMGKTNHDTVVENFSWNKIGDDLRKIYNTVSDE